MTSARSVPPVLPRAQRLVLVVMGVSGCGKSTVAGLLAAQLGWDLAEGDDMHPAANVARMAAGQPLNDADRRPWLETVAAWIREQSDSERPGVITCSALKRSYRDLLRGDHVVFVYLAGRREEIARRLGTRRGHYMPASLLDSQFADLEPPAADERSITVSIGPSAGDLVSEIVAQLSAWDSL